jgi:hypothetical protein
MSGYKNKGSIGPVQLKTEQSYDPNTLYTTVHKHRGTLAALETLRDEYIAAGVRVSMSPDDESNDYYTLTATYSASSAGSTTPASETSALADKWTLESNMLQKSLWTLPAVVTELNVLTDRADRAWLIKTLKLFIDGDDTILPAYPTVEDILDAASAGPPAVYLSATVFNDLVDLMTNGVDSYEVPQWVLKRTIELPPACTVIANDQYVNRIYSTTGMATVEGMPVSGLRFSLTSIAPVGYWLKRSPTVEYTRNGNTTITYEWWHVDSWALMIYGTAIA